jgi:3-oxoacyl-[acyl-carrier-protein] synthase II
MSDRVVITGIGAVTPIGSTAQGLWAGVRAGKSAVRVVSRFDASGFRSRLAAEVNGFDPLDWMDARVARRLDRFAQFGVAAAQQAITHSELDLARVDLCLSGVSLGSALGGIAFGEAQHAKFLGGGLRAVSPMLALAVYGGAGGANIAIGHGLRGPNLTNASSCASGLIAIGEAARAIRNGEAKVMLAGGVETPLAPLTFGAFSVIRAMSARNSCPTTASRPFDRDRDGFVMGEGAGMLVLEERSSAEQRGARMYGEILGYAQTNDAFHMTQPRPAGEEAARAIRLAMLQARIASEEVEYVNAHATSTPLGDVAETRAIRRALGPRAERVRVSGTKGLYGHPLGASGAIEVAITAMAMEEGFLPGTANLHAADDECNLNLIPLEGIQARASTSLITSFGFGGVNAALVLRHV